MTLGGPAAWMVGGCSRPGHGVPARGRRDHTERDEKPRSPAQIRPAARCPEWDSNPNIRLFRPRVVSPRGRDLGKHVVLCGPVGSGSVVLSPRGTGSVGRSSPLSRWRRWYALSATVATSGCLRSACRAEDARVQLRRLGSEGVAGVDGCEFDQCGDLVGGEADASFAEPQMRDTSAARLLSDPPCRSAELGGDVFSAQCRPRRRWRCWRCGCEVVVVGVGGRHGA
jgi:hypothetical protein